jgi:hypothetical protein
MTLPRREGVYWVLYFYFSRAEGILLKYKQVPKKYPPPQYIILYLYIIPYYILRILKIIWVVKWYKKKLMEISFLLFLGNGLRSCKLP